MKKICKYCEREFITNNKTRKSCYECKKLFPYSPSGFGAAPFNRKQRIQANKTKLINPNKK